MEKTHGNYFSICVMIEYFAHAFCAFRPKTVWMCTSTSGMTKQAQPFVAGGRQLGSFMAVQTLNPKPQTLAHRP